MGDLDICLIEEFAKRPAFYDKTNSHFKDKRFTDIEWRSISDKMGYSGIIISKI